MSRRTLVALWFAALPLLLFPILLRGGTGVDTPKPATAAATQNEGERLFEMNCSRCHMPPMSISPRTTGTILMHMRTRARLSRHDEQALLKFMAP
jgi:mono/diheme cytochrome c family protein